MEELILVLDGEEELVLTIEDAVGSYVPPYEGEYEVTPLAFEETELQTDGKRMTQNVRVLEIPYSSVSNPQDGRTVNIG